MAPTISPRVAKKLFAFYRVLRQFPGVSAEREHKELKLQNTEAT